MGPTREAKTRQFLASRLVLLALATPLSAAAHSVIVTEGDLRIEGNVLSANLVFTRHDLQHFQVNVDDAAEIAAFLRRATAQLTVFDDRGAHLPQRLIRIEHANNPQHGANKKSAHVSIAWNLVADVRFLTLRLNASRTTSFPNWQIRLTAFGDAAAVGTAELHLSSRGNAAVLNVAALRGDAKDSDALVVQSSEALEIGRVTLEINDRNVEIHASLPAELLTACQLLPAQPNGQLTANTVAEHSAGISAWVRRHARLRVDGLLVTPENIAVRLTGPHLGADSGTQGHEGDATCYWSGRVNVILKATSSHSVSHAELKWSAFNPGILRYDARVKYENQIVAAGELIGSAPYLSFNRTENGLIASVGQRAAEIE